eukprot:EG_transcript_45249
MQVVYKFLSELPGDVPLSTGEDLEKLHRLQKCNIKGKCDAVWLVHLVASLQNATTAYVKLVQEREICNIQLSASGAVRLCNCLNEIRKAKYAKNCRKCDFPPISH